MCQFAPQAWDSFHTHVPLPRLTIIRPMYLDHFIILPCKSFQPLKQIPTNISQNPPCIDDSASYYIPIQGGDPPVWKCV